MKILHVTPYYAPAFSYGGPPKAVYELAKRQSRLGHQVSVLTTTAFQKDKILPTGTKISEGVKVTRLGNISNWVMWRYHFCQPLGVRSFLKDHQYDVIHLHELRTLLNLFVLLFVKKETIIISPWGTAPYNNSLVWFKKIFDWFLTPQLKKIKHGIAQTTHELSVIKEQKLARRATIVPLAVDTAEFRHSITKNQARKMFSLSETDFVYLFLGRFSPAKGLDLVVATFAKLQKKFSNAKLLLVGRDDNYLEQLMAHIDNLNLKDRVIVNPPLYGPDRVIAYRAADVFVFMPSVYEETGTACLEALACKIPVITCAESEIPYFKKIDGVLYSQKTQISLIKTMIAVYNHRYFVNIDKLKKLFDWSTVTKQIVNVYENEMIS